MRSLILVLVLICFLIPAISSAQTEEPKQKKKYSFLLDSDEPEQADKAYPQLNKETQELFDKAVRRFDAEDYDDAIGWFKKVLSAQPGYVPAMKYTGLAFMNKGKKSKKIKDEKYIYEFNKAKDSFDAIMKADPDFKDAWYYRGMCYRYLDYWPQNAIDDLTVYIDKFGVETPVSFNQRGLAFNQRGYFEEAIKDFQMSIKLDPKFLDSYINLMTAYEALENYTDAIKYFEKLMLKYPNAATPVYYRGLSYFQNRDYGMAIADFNKALQISPKHEDAKIMRDKARALNK